MPRRGSSLLCAAAAALAAAGCADRSPLAPPGDGLAPSARSLGAPAAGGTYLVGFAGAPRLPAAVLRAAGGRVVNAVPRFNVLTLEGVTDPGALRRARPAFVEAAFEVRLGALPGDGRALERLPADPPMAASAGPADAPWLSSGVQWNLRAMRAPASWSVAGGEGVTVCIVDTGVDQLHQELDGKVVARANFVAAEPRLDDPNGHGTHVAGIAGGRGVVAPGVAPGVSILAARVLGASGSGGVTDILNGMLWCVDNGAHVVNVSLGGIRYLGLPSYVTTPIVYGLVVDYAASQGVVVVAAAGNDNLRLPNPAQIVLPAQVPGTIVVGATGPVSRIPALPIPLWDPFDPAQTWQGPDGRAFYSNFGPAVHVFAPGGRGSIPYSFVRRYHDNVFQGSVLDNVWSACSGQSPRSGAVDVGGAPGLVGPCAGSTDRYVSLAGTSMAAPHVAGLAALLYDELGGARTPANRARVMACIRGTTDDVGDPAVFGGGRVNAERALDALRAGAC